MGDSNGLGQVDPSTPEIDRGTCQGCRRRKLKCSKETPSCMHCNRLGTPCVYEGKKGKPGLKTGAVESLSRRIDALEEAVHSQQSGRNEDQLRGSLEILSKLGIELCKLVNQNTAAQGVPLNNSGSVNNTSPESLASGQHYTSNEPIDPSIRARKRRRVDTCGNPTLEIQLPLQELTEDVCQTIPPSDLLEDIVDCYFTSIQPWIPILHETRFRARISDLKQLPGLIVVLHAIVVAAVRFVRPEAHGLSLDDLKAWARRSRNMVLLTAMNGLSVENLQALIIIAFDDIGHGNASRAWPIIGSLTRTVEYLQLSVEQDDFDKGPLLKPLVSLLPPKQWVEEEERRRVFWSIFNLDRYCSVTTGWHTSLTSDDVCRRLPADGGLWYKEEAVVTPYFGIWDRSAAKIGNSIAFLPASYTSGEGVAQPALHHGSPISTSGSSAQPDMSAVGAFAYCIEATESLSRVTTFFLQQRINFHDRQEVSNWLTRFKELDLRLVHWKMFLPQKWKDSNISREPTVINMDPNLTLAHATHNTSMILLHQRIAYPPDDWTNIVELPSRCSAEICLNAAMEVQNIAARYLDNTPNTSPVGNLFAFCVFVAARVLLVHKHYYRSELSSTLWWLVDSLDMMAGRWAGSGEDQSLAGIYANHIRELQQKCAADPDVSVDVLGYSTIVSNQSSACAPRQPTRGQPQSDGQVGASGLHQRPEQNQGLLNTSLQKGTIFRRPWQEPNSSAVDGQSVPLDTRSHAAGAGPEPSAAELESIVDGVGSGSPDELAAISYLLMEPSFVEMDRVISIDDMLFSMNTPMQNGQPLPL